MIIELRKVKDTEKKGKRNDSNDTFNIVSFVLRARSFDPSRAILEYLCVEAGDDGKKTIVCTDGRRLHYSKPLENLIFEVGLYRVLKVTPNLIWLDLMPKDIGTYPMWRQVIPENVPCSTEISISSEHYHFSLCVKTHMATGGYYNLDYLLECFPFGQKAATVTISCDEKKDGLSPVIISHEQGHAILMPVRVV